MTRRLNPCKTCGPDDSSTKFALPRGFTRHADRICSWCRRYGPPKPPINFGGRRA